MSHVCYNTTLPPSGGGETLCLGTELGILTWVFSLAYPHLLIS